MSYEDKMGTLESLLEHHNKQANHLPVDIAEVKRKLSIDGATSEEALAQCSFEDLERCGIPRLIAKQLAGIFRATKTATGVSFVSSRAAERMSVDELLGRYNPIEDNAVYKQLDRLSKGMAFIVFGDDNQVDVVTSVILANEIKQGFGERKGGINVNGVARVIYKVGERPDNFVDENPIFHNRALRPDGTCDQLNRSWLGVPTSTRQLIYLAVQEGSINPNTKDAHEILDLALQDGAFAKLSSRYMDAAIKYSSMKTLGTLPLLKIELGKQINKKDLSGGKKVTV